MLNCFGEILLCQILSTLLSWGCIPYGICRFQLLFWCTIRILHVVTMMHVRLAYYELILLSQVGLTVCSCNQTLQICDYRLICGEELFIVWEDLGWLVPAVIICPTVEDGNICLRCTVPLWNGYWRFVFLYMHCFLYDYLGELTNTWCSCK